MFQEANSLKVLESTTFCSASTEKNRSKSTNIHRAHILIEFTLFLRPCPCETHCAAQYPWRVTKPLFAKTATGVPYCHKLSFARQCDMSHRFYLIHFLVSKDSCCTVKDSARKLSTCKKIQYRTLLHFSLL